jgi:hypothetical protein
MKLFVELPEDVFSRKSSKLRQILNLANHCQGHGLFPTKLMHKQLGYTPGFPLLCRLYATNERLRKIEDFFEKPLLILQKDISGLLDHDIAAFCAMVLIVLYDGKLPVEYLDVFEEDGIDEVKIDTVVKAYCLDKNTALILNHVKTHNYHLPLLRRPL